MVLNNIELEFWNKYLSTLPEKPKNLSVRASMAGNRELANKLLNLYLIGHKTAGSGLVKDYQNCNEQLPKVGEFWIILDSNSVPKCIVKTIKVEINNFDQIPESIAIAEGEGDLSLEYWKKAHRTFFTPFLKKLGIDMLDKAQIITEHFEVVFKPKNSINVKRNLK